MTTEGLHAPDAQLAALQLQNELLRAQCQELLEQLQQKDRKVESLQHQLQHLLRRLYGRSAEKIDPQQMLLFEKLLEQLKSEAPADAPAAPPEPAPPRPSRNGHGRRRISPDLPRERVVHELAEDERPCPCCGTTRQVIGQEVSEKLDYVPARVKVIEDVQLKYGCPHCEANASPDGPQIVTADKPLSPIEKCLAAPGLLAHVIVSKYSDHLPLHRMEKILARHGIHISRSTMCDWAAGCAAALRPLYNLTGISFLNENARRASVGRAGALEDRFDPFGFLMRGQQLQRLASPPVP